MNDPDLLYRKHSHEFNVLTTKVGRPDASE